MSCPRGQGGGGHASTLWVGQWTFGADGLPTRGRGCPPPPPPSTNRTRISTPSRTNRTHISPPRAAGCSAGRDEAHLVGEAEELHLPGAVGREARHHALRLPRGLAGHSRRAGLPPPPPLSGAWEGTHLVGRDVHAHLLENLRPKRHARAWARETQKGKQAPPPPPPPLGAGLACWSCPAPTRPVLPASTLRKA